MYHTKVRFREIFVLKNTVEVAGFSPLGSYLTRDAGMLLPTAQRWHKDVAQGPELQSLCDRPALPRKTKRKSKAPQGMPQTSSTSTSFYDVGAHRGSSPFSCHTLNSGHRQQQCIIRSSGVWCSVMSFAAFGVSRKRSCALHERSACSFDILTAPARVCVPNTKLRRTQSIANQDTELLRKLPVIHAKKAGQVDRPISQACSINFKSSP